MTLTGFIDNSELFRSCVLWWQGRDQTITGFPILPAAVTPTPNGSWTTTSTGVTRSLVNFDGSTNYITVGTVSTLNFLHQVGTTGKWSIACWYRSNSFAANQRIITTSRASSSNIGFTLSITNTTRILYFEITYGSAGNYIASSSGGQTVPNDNNWHYLGLTYDQSLASQNCKIYLDGALLGTISKTANTPSTSDATYAPTIGGQPTTNILNGNVKDLMIWNGRVLTIDEIISIMRQTNPASGRDFAAVYPGVRGCE